MRPLPSNAPSELCAPGCTAGVRCWRQSCGQKAAPHRERGASHDCPDRRSIRPCRRRRSDEPRGGDANGTAAAGRLSRQSSPGRPVSAPRGTVIGVAAALSILTGAAATWRSLRVDHARPELVTRPQPTVPRSGRERRPGFRHTGSGWRDRRATRFRRQRRDTAGGCSTRCSFAPARTGGEAGGVHRTTGSREPSDLREWRDRPYGSRTLGACRIRTRHLGRGRKKSRPGGRPRRPGRRTSRYPGRHQFLEFVIIFTEQTMKNRAIRSCCWLGFRRPPRPRPLTPSASGRTRPTISPASPRWSARGS